MAKYEVTWQGHKYEVTAPDETSQEDVMRHVADQFQSEIQGRIQRQHEYDAAHPMDTDPTSGMSGVDKFVSGIGSGMTRFTRGAGNLVGAGHVFPSFFGDEALKEEDKYDKPLGDTGAGFAGQLVGQTAASLPLSLAGGAGAAGLKSALSMGGRLLPSGVAGAVAQGGRAALEGGFDAAAVASPDRQGEAAGTGAAVGTGLSVLPGAVGRLVRGVVQKSGAAEDLEALAASQGTKVHIPLTQAADQEGDLVSRGVTSLYQHGLPIVPGVSGQLRRQSTVAANQLKEAFQHEYDSTVGSYSFNVPSDFKDEVAARIEAAMPNVDKTTLEKVSTMAADHIDRYASGANIIDGSNLVNAKNAVLGAGLKGVEGDAAKHGAEAFDDIIERELTQGNQSSNLADLSRYRKLTTPDPQTGLTLPESMKATFAEPVVRPNTEGRLALFGSGLYGISHGFGLPFFKAVAGANALATKTAQNFLLGDTAAQKAVAHMVGKYPEMARITSMMLRNAGVVASGDSSNAP